MPRGSHSAGSVAALAGPGAIVWGAGVMNADDRIDPRAELVAVRGPLTREAALRSGVPCPPVYGDPALLVPRFLLITALGWVDSYEGLISTELVSVSGIFFLRQCFLAIPRDLEDAARLEGAGEWTVFRRIVLPLSGPALATLVVLALADQWKSFFWPLVATSSPDMQVLEVGIAHLHGAYDLNWPYQMAAATTAVIPMVALYFVAHKYFMRGIDLTGPR